MNSPKKPFISGYTTTFNCIDKRYPFELCLRSLLGFCDEVSVVDAGSTDGTVESLIRMSAEDRRIKVRVSPVDFSHPRWAIHMDGYLKSKARDGCTGEFCWQTDNDEVVDERDFEKIKALPQMLGEVFAQYPIVYLPMVEFWGSFERIRADFFTWKQRLSLNDPRITHGIPNEFRMVDAQGFEYPKPFDSDSCNYIYRDTKESVRSAIPVQVPKFDMSPDEFDQFFHAALDLLPSVLHVSWLNLRRKIEHYRDFWPKFHASMYNLPKVDSPDNNVMFNKPWSQVTDEDINQKVKELDELGPRSFHHKLDPLKKGATVRFRRSVPDSLTKWALGNC